MLRLQVTYLISEHAPATEIIQLHLPPGDWSRLTSTSGFWEKSHTLTSFRTKAEVSGRNERIHGGKKEHLKRKEKTENIREKNLSTPLFQKSIFTAPLLAEAGWGGGGTDRGRVCNAVHTQAGKTRRHFEQWETKRRLRRREEPGGFRVRGEAVNRGRGGSAVWLQMCFLPAVHRQETVAVRGAEKSSPVSAASSPPAQPPLPALTRQSLGEKAEEESEVVFHF